MAAPGVDRSLVVSSRLAEGYHLSELGLKNLQHVFTVWFPRAIYSELTEDTVRVNVVVRMGRTTGRGVYATEFLRADGSVIKKTEYDEDRLVGRICEAYDQRRSGYCGKKEGLDFRIVVYNTAAPVKTINRPNRP